MPTKKSTALLGALCLSFFAVVVQLPAATPLTLGTTYSGTLTLPGETHTFNFTGSAGQRLFLDAQDQDGVPIYVTLYSPAGTYLYQQNDDSDWSPIVLTEPGTYSL